MAEDVTKPPCQACRAHEGLEELVTEATNKKLKEHHDRLTSLDKAVANIRWMNLIGKFMLTTMLGYFIAIGYYVFTIDNVKSNVIDAVNSNIKKGEKLHYKNERDIAKIDGKLEIIIQYLERTKP